MQSKRDILDLVTGPDEDLNQLLFHTVASHIQVSTTNNSTELLPTSKRIQLQSDSTEFGDDFSQPVWQHLNSNSSFYFRS